MKRSSFLAVGVTAVGLLALPLRAQAPAAADAPRTSATKKAPAARGIDAQTNPELLELAAAVTQLLESGDVDAFVATTTASLADWRRLVPPGVDPKESPGNDRVVERHARSIEASAQHVLELARRAGAIPGRVRFTVKSISSPTSSRVGFRIGGRPATQPFVPELRVVLAGEPIGDADGKPLRGEYQLALGDARSFPDGWRTAEGVRWVALPEGLADDTMRRELALTNLVTQHTLTATDDPTLQRLGETVATFLRTRSVHGFVEATTLSIDELIEFYQSIDSPAASTADERRDQIVAASTAAAQALVDLQERIGADLSDAKLVVQQVLAERPSFTCYGEAQGLRAASVRVTLAVESSRNAKSGRPLAGTYTISLGDAMRIDQRWVLMDDKVRVQEYPAGVVAAADAQYLELENYVAENRTLPPGYPAPNVDLVKLADGTPLTLAALRGKVVVLEFWASWYGPCQEPMERLQRLREEHPDWQDRVAVIALSIDEKAEQARTHLERRGWFNTLNAWAGEGAWTAPATKAFRVRGVPMAYVLDRDGRVLKAGPPLAMNVGQIVDAELRRGGE